MFNRFRWTFIFSLLLTLILSLAACSRDKTPEANVTPDASAVVESAAPSTAKSPTVAVQQAASRAPISSGDLAIADLTELDSYRSRSVITPVDDQEGGAGAIPFLGGVTVMETEYVRDPAASHTVIMDEAGNVTTEIVTVEGQSWMNMGGFGWITARQLDVKSSTSGMTPEVEAIIRQMAGGMERVGKETVNGVRAIHYKVDSEYEMPIDQPAAEDVAATPGFALPAAVRGTVTGDIWIAAERDLPQVVVRSVTTQKIALLWAEDPGAGGEPSIGEGFFSGKDTFTVSEERDVTDINQPITITPPADVIELPAPAAEPPAFLPTPLMSAPQEVPAADTAEALTVAPLDSLDSYQATLTTTVTSNDMAVSTVVSEDWTADPPARRVRSDLGGVEIEYVITEEGAWVKMAGRWVSTEATGADDIRGDLIDYTEPTDDMTFVGNESVEGVNTRFYTRTDSMGGQTMVTEVWVADEPTLPPVVVKVRHTLQLQSILTVTEVLVTNINQPLTIEPPN